MHEFSFQVLPFLVHGKKYLYKFDTGHLKQDVHSGVYLGTVGGFHQHLVRVASAAHGQEHDQHERHRHLPTD